MEHSFMTYADHLLQLHANSITESPALDVVQNPQNNIVLFGAGLGGLDILKWITAHSGHVTCFCDNNYKNVHQVNNIPVISPSELMERYTPANTWVVISVGDKYHKEINDQLIQLGWDQTHILPTYLFEDKYAAETIAPHIAGFQWMRNHVEDDLSRKVIDDKLKNYFEFFELPHQADYLRYFDNTLIKIGPSDIYLDGGTYDGDSILDFIRHAKNSYKHIHGFEPDAQNFKKACDNLNHYDNISLNHSGLWSCRTNLSFSCGHKTLSCLDPSGNTTVPVTSIDEYVSDFAKDNWPTIIKFDIQGAEVEAIKGAKNVISQSHPQLILCAYHELSHLYCLAQMVYELDNTYRFYLRHYSYNQHETVLYAI